MNIVSITILSTALICASMSSYADKFTAGFEYGRGELVINQKTSPEDRKQSVDSNHVVGFFGYEVMPNLILEADLFVSVSDDIDGDVEQYRNTGIKLLVGYKINIGPVFSITPEVGRAAWILTIDEDSNSFSDDDETEKRGYDYIAQVTASVKLNNRINLYAVHSDHDFGFGDDRSTRFGMTFKF